MTTLTNYATNGSAEDAGTFATYWAANTGITVTQAASHAVDGTHSALIDTTAASGFGSAYYKLVAPASATLGGLQVWGRWTWQGSGPVDALLMRAWNAGYAGSTDAVAGSKLTIPASPADVVFGPLTLPANCEEINLLWANDPGDAAALGYIDCVMLTTFDPTGVPFFADTLVVADGPSRITTQFQLRPY